MAPHHQVLLTFLSGFLLTLYTIPSVIRVSKLKNLFDEPCQRKRHKNKVPALGGVSIFAGFVFSLTFWATQSQIVELQYIIASSMILFFIGLKDDLMNIRAYKKLIGQILAACILVLFADIRLTSLYGIFDVYSIDYATSCGISILTIIGLTNAINLVDGIDTLAASIGIFACALYGAWFYLSENDQYAIVSFSLLGALLAFLYYNRPPAKIFMGDTGSLVLGLTLSLLSIQFVEFNRNYTGPAAYRLTSVPAIAISILIIPIFDTTRVFFLRILQGKNPFSPDLNHLHHILTDLGYGHLKSTSILLSLNISLVLIALILSNDVRGEAILLINILLALCFTFYFSQKRRSILRRQSNAPYVLAHESKATLESVSSSELH